MDLEVHIIIEIFGAGLLQVRHLWRKSPGLVFTTRRVGKNSPGLVGGGSAIRGRGRCAIQLAGECLVVGVEWGDATFLPMLHARYIYVNNSRKKHSPIHRMYALLLIFIEKECEGLASQAFT